MAILQIDMSQLMSVYKKFLNISTNPLSIEQQSAFDKMSDKTFYWQVSLEKDSIGIEWSIK